MGLHSVSLDTGVCFDALLQRKVSTPSKSTVLPHLYLTGLPFKPFFVATSLRRLPLFPSAEPQTLHCSVLIELG